MPSKAPRQHRAALARVEDVVTSWPPRLHRFYSPSCEVADYYDWMWWVECDRRRGRRAVALGLLAALSASVVAWPLSLVGCPLWAAGAFGAMFGARIGLLVYGCLR